MSAQRELIFGEKAIEVASMLGDSVVDVKHCMDPHGGKVSPRTWGMLAAGGLGLLLSAIAFVVSVRTAAYNQGAQDYWTHVAHKPQGAFRAVMLSTAYDWVAFGGFLLGLVTIAVGLTRARREKQDPSYKIGTAPDVRLAVEGAPAPSFPLIAPKGDDFVFNFGVGMAGDMVIDGKATPLAELAASGHARPSTSAVGAFELPIPTNGRIRANIGLTSFQVSAVAKPAAQATPMFAAMQSRTLAYFAGSLGVHLGLVLLLAQIPMDDGSASFDLAALEPTDIRTSTTNPEDVPPEMQPDTADTTGAGKAGSGKNMALEEGQAGTTASNRMDSHMRMINRNVEDTVAQARRDVEAARTAGILGSERLQDAALFANLTSTSALSSGPDSTDVWGAIYGAEGEGYGTFGYGRHGFGPGGGCYGQDCGIVGTPTGYGKIGLGKFQGSGWDAETGGRFPMKTHKVTNPVATIGDARVVGDLDKSIIRRYIKRYFDRIGYCYEKELLAHPGIEGTVTIQFFISPEGSVTTSTGQGFNGDVAGCVAGVIHAIEFPKPQGGGGVTVNYPFTFHAAGSGS